MASGGLREVCLTTGEIRWRGFVRVHGRHTRGCCLWRETVNTGRPSVVEPRLQTDDARWMLFITNLCRMICVSLFLCYVAMMGYLM